MDEMTEQGDHKKTNSHFMIPHFVIQNLNDGDWLTKEELLVYIALEWISQTDPTSWGLDAGANVCEWNEANIVEMISIASNLAAENCSITEIMESLARRGLIEMTTIQNIEKRISFKITAYENFKSGKLVCGWSQP